MISKKRRKELEKQIDEVLNKTKELLPKIKEKHLKDNDIEIKGFVDNFYLESKLSVRISLQLMGNSPEQAEALIKKYLQDNAARELGFIK